jgi:hypothetical protein
MGVKSCGQVLQVFFFFFKVSFMFNLMFERQQQMSRKKKKGGLEFCDSLDVRARWFFLASSLVTSGVVACLTTRLLLV